MESDIPRSGLAWRVLRLSLGVGLVAALLWWLGPSPGELLERADPDPVWGLLAFVGTLVASLVTAWRWQILAEGMGGTRLPFGVYLHALVLTRFLGQFAAPTLAMDLVGRGVALRAGGSERGVGHAATQVVLERILDLLLPLALLGWALAMRAWAWPAWPSLAAVVVVFSLACLPGLRPGVKLASRVYLGVLRKLGKTVPELHDEAPVDRARANAVVGLSLARFAAVILQFWGVALAVGVDLSFLDMTVATPVAQLAGLVGITPGALGIQEAGWAGGLSFVGLDVTDVALYVLAARVAVVTNFGILSLITLPIRKAPETAT